MAEFRYPQFCAIARAAEILGERWTILVLRELFIGPQRFTDLRKRLSGVSPSVLSERLNALERRAIIRKAHLSPPAASTVYELTEAGAAVAPVIGAIAEWGKRFVLPPREGEQLDPDRLRFALGVCAKHEPTPAHRIEIRMPTQTDEVVLRAVGGPRGTRIEDYEGEADLTVRGEPIDIVAAVSGHDTEGLMACGRVVVSGTHTDASSLTAAFGELFEFPPPSTDTDDQPQNQKQGENK